MSGFFHFSEAVSLALHGLEIMARDVDKVYTARELAGKLHASEAHLAKVFQRLVKSDLINSQRGPNGGFTLKRSPAEITLIEIFSAIEGQLCLDNCPLIKDRCPFKKCIFSGLMFKFQKEFRDFVASKTLDDFILQ